MGLLLRNQVKLITASGGGTLVTPANRGYLIKGIFCSPSAADTYITLLCQGTTVGTFRAKGKAGNHIPFPFIKTSQIYEYAPGGIITRLRMQGQELLDIPIGPYAGDLDNWLKNRMDIRFPVAAGETFTVSRYAEAGNLALLYDVYDDVDINPAMPNGSQSLIRRYLHYITNVLAGANGSVALSTSVKSGGPDTWPISPGNVPDNTTFRLLAIAACPHAFGAAATSQGYTTHLIVMRGSTALFDSPEDHVGIPMLGETTAALGAASQVSFGSLIGPCTAENPGSPFVVDPVLEFGKGETLTLALQYAGWSTPGLTAGLFDCAVVLERQYGVAA